MFGRSDNNRSQDQGGSREALNTKEGGGKSPTVGTRTGSEAAMRATSVLGNAKSNRHRKTHRVEPDGPDGEFTHLTRGDLPGESEAGVSRGRSSEDTRVTAGGAKGRRDGETRIARSPRGNGREGFRNEAGVTTTVATRSGASGLGGWIAVWNVSAGAESGNGRRKGKR